MACNGSRGNAWRSVTPKSATTGVSLSRNRTLVGEMPPWTTPTLWAAASALAMAWPSVVTSSAGNGPTRSTRAARECAHSSIRRAISPEGSFSTPSTMRIDVTLRTVASLACSFRNADIVRRSARSGKTFNATGTPAR